MALSVQEVVLQAVENPKSFCLGNALTELLRYREGQGVSHLVAARKHIELLEGLEGLNAANPEVVSPE